MLLLAIATALVVPQVVRAVRNASRGECRWNLRSLWQVQFNYSAQYGAMPDETGGDFWLILQKSPRPLIDRYEVFLCPQTDETPGPGRCSFRGPARPIRLMDLESPVAADKEGNHGVDSGGTILMKTGDVSEYEQSDVMWFRARLTTKE
jgi:hypothetical protein